MEAPERCTSGGCPIGGNTIAMACGKADASGDVIVPGPDCPFRLLAAKDAETRAALKVVGRLLYLLDCNGVDVSDDLRRAVLNGGEVVK